jgi:hypothetical protein
MKWNWRKSPQFEPARPEDPPPPKKWPAILGVTVAAWAILGGVLVALLGSQPAP